MVFHLKPKSFKFRFALHFYFVYFFGLLQRWPCSKYKFERTQAIHGRFSKLERSVLLTDHDASWFCIENCFFRQLYFFFWPHHLHIFFGYFLQRERDWRLREGRRVDLLGKWSTLLPPMFLIQLWESYTVAWLPLSSGWVGLYLFLDKLGKI